MDKNVISRRDFLIKSSLVTAGLFTTGSLYHCTKPVKGMRMGLVTYLWGQDWDLPTLVANCELTGYLGVELRTQHAH